MGRKIKSCTQILFKNRPKFEFGNFSSTKLNLLQESLTLRRKPTNNRIKNPCSQYTFRESEI